MQSIGRCRVLLQLFLSVFRPFVDETIQLFTPGRSGQISDVWLDMSGVLFGTAAAVCFFRAAAYLMKKGEREG